MTWDELKAAGWSINYWGAKRGDSKIVVDLHRNGCYSARYTEADGSGRFASTHSNYRSKESALNALMHSPVSLPEDVMVRTLAMKPESGIPASPVEAKPTWGVRLEAAGNEKIDDTTWKVDDLFVQGYFAKGYGSFALMVDDFGVHRVLTQVGAEVGDQTEEALMESLFEAFLALSFGKTTVAIICGVPR